MTNVFQEAVRYLMDKDRKMWQDIHKKAKKEDKIEAKKMAMIEKRMKKLEAKEGKKREDSEAATDGAE